MTVTALAAQSFGDTGVVPTDLHASVTAQNSFPNQGKLLLMVTGVTGSVTLTFKDQTTVDGQVGPDRVVTVAAGQTKFIGDFPPSIFDDANGNIEMDVNTPANIATLYALILNG